MQSVKAPDRLHYYEDRRRNCSRGPKYGFLLTLAVVS